MVLYFTPGTASSPPPQVLDHHRRYQNSALSKIAMLQIAPKGHSHHIRPYIRLNPSPQQLSTHFDRSFLKGTSTYPNEADVAVPFIIRTEYCICKKLGVKGIKPFSIKVYLFIEAEIGARPCDYSRTHVTVLCTHAQCVITNCLSNVAAGVINQPEPSLLSAPPPVVYINRG